jgi:hypothetical protein
MSGRFWLGSRRRPSGPALGLGTPRGYLPPSCPMRQRAVASSCARAGRSPVRLDHALAAGGQAARIFGLARKATSLRDSRATPHDGSERSQAVGEAGLTPASLLLDPASLQPIRVVSGGGGIRTLEGPNGP